MVILSSAHGKAFPFQLISSISRNIKKQTWVGVLLFKMLQLLKQAMKQAKVPFLLAELLQ